MGFPTIVGILGIIFGVGSFIAAYRIYRRGKKGLAAFVSLVGLSLLAGAAFIGIVFIAFQEGVDHYSESCPANPALRDLQQCRVAEYGFQDFEGYRTYLGNPRNQALCTMAVEEVESERNELLNAILKCDAPHHWAGIRCESNEILSANARCFSCSYSSADDRHKTSLVVLNPEKCSVRVLDAVGKWSWADVQADIQKQKGTPLKNEASL